MDGALIDPKMRAKRNLGFSSIFADFLNLGSGHAQIMHIA